MLNGKRKFFKRTKIRRITKIPDAMLLCVKLIALVSRLILCRVEGLFNRRKLILIGLYEHIGDIVACEPVIPYMHSENPRAWIIWALHKPYAELLSSHPRIHKVLKLTYFTEWIILKKILNLFSFVDKVVDLHINHHACRTFNQKLNKSGNGIDLKNYLIGKSLLQVFTLSGGLSELKGAPLFYLDKSTRFKDLPHKYIVLHTRSNMRIKDWDSEKWEQLCGELIRRDYHIFEIGLHSCVKLTSKLYTDYTGKRPLQEIASLISSCKLFIGIDSGFAHIANALQKEGLILLGRYENGSISVNSYNPFTGKYSHASNIIAAEKDFVRSINADAVIGRAVEKLTIMN